jgi:hypothetical protein
MGCHFFLVHVYRHGIASVGHYFMSTPGAQIAIERSPVEVKNNYQSFFAFDK